jgi:hypothetical protein
MQFSTQTQKDMVLALQRTYWELDQIVFDSDNEMEGLLNVDSTPYLRALAQVENALKTLGFRLKMNDLTDEWDLVKIKSKA